MPSIKNFQNLYEQWEKSTEKIFPVLFLDSETVSLTDDYSALSPIMKKHWAKKSLSLQRYDEKLIEMTEEEIYYEKAAIYAEFAKVVVISCGFLVKTEGSQIKFRIKSFVGDDEKKVLQDFSELLFRSPKMLLCAHNGFEFDFPFLGRRMLVNRLPIPAQLDTRGLKPWDIQNFDTMEFWKFADRKNFTSLELLTEILGLPSPKNDIDGSQVSTVYWKDNDLQRIAKYCENDVLALARVALRLIDKPNIGNDQVDIA